MIDVDVQLFQGSIHRPDTFEMFVAVKTHGQKYYRRMIFDKRELVIAGYLEVVFRQVQHELALEIEKTLKPVQEHTSDPEVVK